ncbi:alpha/beta hydrolase [Candidatus Gracilibacteria bacterium]|nr:alpha/beta hydrolase [Candidatus Gracilibacteria bacterium]
MEKYITLPTPDGFEINGVLNWKEKSEKLIIFVHGGQCDLGTHILYNGTKYFTKKGYATFRFNLYDYGDRNRKLHECDFTNHADDIDSVVDFFENEYSEIILIGHSFGGLAILYSSQVVSQSVLWDCSVHVEGAQMRRLEDIGEYYLDKGTSWCYVNKNLFKQYLEESREKITQMKIPTSVICAGDSTLPERWDLFRDNIPNLKNYFVVDGANHFFDEEGKEEELFEKTLEFIEN